MVDRFLSWNKIPGYASPMPDAQIQDIIIAVNSNHQPSDDEFELANDYVSENNESSVENGDYYENYGDYGGSEEYFN